MSAGWLEAKSVTEKLRHQLLIKAEIHTPVCLTSNTILCPAMSCQSRALLAGGNELTDDVQKTCKSSLCSAFWTDDVFCLALQLSRNCGQLYFSFGGHTTSKKSLHFIVQGTILPKQHYYTSYTNYCYCLMRTLAWEWGFLDLLYHMLFKHLYFLQWAY